MIAGAGYECCARRLWHWLFADTGDRGAERLCSSAGLRGSHVLAVVLTCALSDAVLIAAGVTGFGRLSEIAPWVAGLLRWGGALFLIVYGVMAFRSAWRGGGSLEAANEGGGSLRAAILTCLALTWLNPHVYLDTVVLIGSIATRFEGARLEFGLGAVAASLVFFFSLGYGARLLAPVFRKEVAWRWLDAGVGALMWSIAAGLIFGH